ncbi:hypothetical protein QBC32DRAFT_214071 [Pseudoneurospora amorphoporcata]|uniref:Uncharacterized protein n=1 Tax=Pseudoneurospora amorphoporcata TaxID=241081 RepID=A0AAN6NTL6_9PEZI|nr:hypothetical protein QBC32DRAFT_214071 [Pseudoneurospora amorphoporcata]
MPAERTNPRRTRQATNSPPRPSLRRQDAVVHQTVYDHNGQAVDFGMYTDQVIAILNSLSGGRGQVQPPPRQAPRSARHAPYPVRGAARHQNLEDVDPPPLYTKLPGAGEATVDIAMLPAESLPEYEEAGSEERKEEGGDKESPSGGMSRGTYMYYSWILSKGMKSEWERSHKIQFNRARLRCDCLCEKILSVCCTDR